MMFVLAAALNEDQIKQLKKKNVPIPSSLIKEFPTNWELSTARATNVTRYLIEEVGFPSLRIACAGYGEEHPVMTETALKRWQEEEHKLLEKKQKEFLSKIAPQIPQELRKYLLSIRKYIFIEGADWSKLVKDKLQEDIIEQIKEMEKEEAHKYVLERHKKMVEVCNTTPEERAANRRVDIVIERLGGQIIRREREIKARAPSLPRP